MPELLSTNEILKNFEDSAASADAGHTTRAFVWMVIASLLLLCGLAAMSFSHPILAALLLTSAVLSNQKSNTHHVLAEVSNQHRAMAQLIASTAPKLEAESDICRA